MTSHGHTTCGISWDRLQAAGTPLPASLREVRVLIPWAVEFRYGETIEDLLERKQALALADEIIV